MGVNRWDINQRTKGRCVRYIWQHIMLKQVQRYTSTVRGLSPLFGCPNLQQWSACSGSAQNGSVGRAKARRTRWSFGIYGGKYGPRISEIGWAVQVARPAQELRISDVSKSGTDGSWTVWFGP